MCPSLGVGFGEGGDVLGFYLIDASGFSMVAGQLTLCCGLFVLAYGCGRRASGYILGMGLFVEAGLYHVFWSVGILLEGWQWRGRRLG